jgi:hypothetical protein
MKLNELHAIELLKKFTENFEDCSHCDGNGFEPVDEVSACRACGGTGLQVKSRGIMLELHEEALDLLATKGAEQHILADYTDGDLEATKRALLHQPASDHQQGNFSMTQHEIKTALEAVKCVLNVRGADTLKWEKQ